MWHIILTPLEQKHNRQAFFMKRMFSFYTTIVKVYKILDFCVMGRQIFNEPIEISVGQDIKLFLIYNISDVHHTQVCRY